MTSLLAQIERRKRLEKIRGKARPSPAISKAKGGDGPTLNEALRARGLSTRPASPGRKHIMRGSATVLEDATAGDVWAWLERGGDTKPATTKTRKPAKKKAGKKKPAKKKASKKKKKASAPAWLTELKRGTRFRGSDGKIAKYLGYERDGVGSYQLRFQEEEEGLRALEYKLSAAQFKKHMKPIAGNPTKKKSTKKKAKKKAKKKPKKKSTKKKAKKKSTKKKAKKKPKKKKAKKKAAKKKPKKKAKKKSTKKKPKKKSTKKKPKKKPKKKSKKKSTKKSTKKKAAKKKAKKKSTKKKSTKKKSTKKKTKKGKR